MDKAERLRRWSNVATAAAVSLFLLALALDYFAPGRVASCLFYVAMAVSIPAGVIVLASWVRALQSGKVAEPTDGFTKVFLPVFAIVGGVANAYIALVYARPLLALAKRAFFIGDVQYSGAIGAAAVLTYLMMSVYISIGKHRDIRLLLALVFSLPVPLAPILVVFLLCRRTYGDSVNTYGVAFITAFLASVLLALYSYPGMAGQSSNGSSPQQLGQPIESLSARIGTLPATVKSGEADAPVGACVNLLGARTKPSLVIESCDKAAYRVIQRVETPRQCPADVDDKFYLNPPSGQWTACLDYAWSTSDCLSITKGASAIRVACNDRSRPGREKPVALLTDSITASPDCPAGGFPHAVRRFTVCTETQS
ncbi:Uncharacterised protein [Mycolicibacterium phlei]|uniref:LppU/SCO3897 family protein n=1 Tax=Mycobacteroides chelonae TaxID=1774 RepID=UPI000A437EAD|nr:hypothetical protein [Mycobacteroides chelonae]VEG16091.1 Uncharacterised protein [Mycolicibacterium phlei]